MITGVWGRITHMNINLKEINWEVVDCIHLTQERVQWKAAVNKVMKLLLHIWQVISFSHC